MELSQIRTLYSGRMHLNFSYEIYFIVVIPISNKNNKLLRYNNTNLTLEDGFVLPPGRWEFRFTYTIPSRTHFLTISQGCEQLGMYAVFYLKDFGATDVDSSFLLFSFRDITETKGAASVQHSL